eukprot:2048326-Prorocentrum_lima.AAC.1
MADAGGAMLTSVPASCTRGCPREDAVVMDTSGETLSAAAVPGAAARAVAASTPVFSGTRSPRADRSGHSAN